MPEFYAPKANPSPAAYGPYDVGIYPYLDQIAQHLAMAGRQRQQAAAMAQARAAQEEFRRQQLALAQEREARQKKIEEALYGTPSGGPGVQGTQEPDIPGELGGATPAVSAPSGAQPGLRQQAQAVASGSLSERTRHDKAMEALRNKIAARTGSGMSEQQRRSALDQKTFNDAGIRASSNLGGASVFERSPKQRLQLQLDQYDLYMRSPGADPEAVKDMALLKDKGDVVLRQFAAAHPNPRVKSYAQLLLQNRVGQNLSPPLVP